MGIKQLFDYYHQCFISSDRAGMFIESAVSIPQDLKEHSFPCLCNRNVSTQIDGRRTLHGGAIRGSLQHDGLLLDSGGELFRGCVVFPYLGEHGQIASASGYRFAKRVRKGQQCVIHWQKPTPEFVLVKNMAAIKEIIHEKAYF